MNVTNEFSRFVHQCSLLNAKYEFVVEYPTEALFISQCTSCVLTIILIIPTVILNGVSVLTILKCPQLKEKISYFLIMMQSSADLAIGLLSIPSLSYICFMETAGATTCVQQLLLMRVIALPIILSMWILTAMTMERYFGVLHPLRHRTLVTKKRIFTFVSCAELLTMVLTVLSFLQEGLFENFSSVFLFLFLLVSIFVYTKIYLTIRKRKNPGNVVENTDTNNKHRFLKEIKLVKSIVLSCRSMPLPLFLGHRYFSFHES